jgi:5-enolpyruvylshikimate-3-phosphate synthase
MVMAFGVLAKTAGARIALSERTSAGVSYPGFFSVLQRVVGP